jgi:hypothetical protein
MHRLYRIFPVMEGVKERVELQLPEELLLILIYGLLALAPQQLAVINLQAVIQLPFPMHMDAR